LNNLQTNRQICTLKTIHGHNIKVFEGDFIARKIIEKGIYEGPLLEFVSQILIKMQEPIVLDIGANIGNHSLAFSLDARKVFAFEPVPEIFSLLSANIKQNNINNIQPVNLALSDNEAEKELYMNTSGNVGASSFDKRDDNSLLVAVTLCRGDEFIKKENVENIDFMKIDVEGHELAVLEGLKSSIRKNRPFIVMEWNDNRTIDRINSSSILDDLFFDYQIYVLGNNYDKNYWEGKSFSRIRRKLHRMFIKKHAKLYRFSSNRLYKNLLFVPNGKEDLLPLKS